MSPTRTHILSLTDVLPVLSQPGPEYYFPYKHIPVLVPVVVEEKNMSNEKMERFGQEGLCPSDRDTPGVDRI
jgi:hypothetical protein